MEKSRSLTRGLWWERAQNTRVAYRLEHHTKQSDKEVVDKLLLQLAWGHARVGRHDILGNLATKAHKLIKGCLLASITHFLVTIKTTQMRQWYKKERKKEQQLSSHLFGRTQDPAHGTVRR